jgi:hypothetical protein
VPQLGGKPLESKQEVTRSSKMTEEAPKKKEAEEAPKKKKEEEESEQKALKTEDEEPKKPSAPGNSGDTGDALKEGDTVESRHGGQDQWFGAKVTTAHGDGSCDLTYDDGDKEKKVLRHRIRRKGDKDRPTLTEGEVVDCRYGGGKKLFPGKIAKVHDDGLGNLSYDVLYNDGDKELKLKRNLIEAACGGGGEGAVTGMDSAEESPMYPVSSARYHYIASVHWLILRVDDFYHTLLCCLSTGTRWSREGMFFSKWARRVLMCFAVFVCAL